MPHLPNSATVHCQRSEFFQIRCNGRHIHNSGQGAAGVLGHVVLNGLGHRENRVSLSGQNHRPAFFQNLFPYLAKTGRAHKGVGIADLLHKQVVAGGVGDGGQGKGRNPGIGKPFALFQRIELGGSLFGPGADKGNVVIGNQQIVADILQRLVVQLHMPGSGRTGADDHLHPVAHFFSNFLGQFISQLKLPTIYGLEHFFLESSALVSTAANLHSFFGKKVPNRCVVTIYGQLQRVNSLRRQRIRRFETLPKELRNIIWQILGQAKN